MPITLKKYLKKSDDDQYTLAKKIKSSQPSVNHYCNGRNMPSVEIMQNIYRATNGQVDANVFYGLYDIKLN